MSRPQAACFGGLEDLFDGFHTAAPLFQQCRKLGGFLRSQVVQRQAHFTGGFGAV